MGLKQLAQGAPGFALSHYREKGTMTDEIKHLRDALQSALKENEALKKEIEELRRDRQERSSSPVDVYDLGILDESKREACPWTGWYT